MAIKNFSLSKNIFYLLILIAIEQVIKFFIDKFMAYHEIINVLPFFSLLKTYNTGIAFSLFNNMPKAILISIGIIITMIFLYLLITTPKNQKIQKIALLLILSGSISNIIDRFFRGHVVDYLYVHIEKINFSFAVFNLADAFILIGAIIIITKDLLNKK